jgi:pSer/pThr/pTyr-binding forkhead associated (FHA) protein
MTKSKVGYKSMKCLLCLFEVRKGQSIVELDKDTILVGRDPQKCDVVLDPLDTLVSRTHFAVERDKGNYFLRDLSKNGTLVNGGRATGSRQRLYHGDVIEAGNAEITFLLDGETRTAQQLFEEGKRNELLEPSYAIQCYSFAHKQSPTNVDYASRLLHVLEQEGRDDDLITGGSYFTPAEMMRLADDARIAAPLANTFVRIGDFARALQIIEQAGGGKADRRLYSIVESIRHQTGASIDENMLATITQKTCEPPVFQRDKLRIHIDERGDFADLRYVERYHKYLQQRIDPQFGGPPKCEVEFHVTIRDHLFSQSLFDQSIILGYYSPDSHRIFIRPRRWLAGKAKEEDFHIVLMHEYVHLRVHDVCGGMWVPMWYNEGLAHLLSGSKTPEECRLLRSAKDRCVPIPLFSDAVFSTAYGNLSIAYLQSYAILLFLAQRFSQEKLVSVLSSLEEQGGSFQRSLESTLGMSLEELDSEWWAVLVEV